MKQNGPNQTKYKLESAEQSIGYPICCLFYFEKWPDVPPDLPIIFSVADQFGSAKNDNKFTDCLLLHNLQPVTQKHNIPEFKLPTLSRGKCLPCEYGLFISQLGSIWLFAIWLTLQASISKDFLKKKRINYGSVARTQLHINAHTQWNQSIVG